MSSGLWGPWNDTLADEKHFTIYLNFLKFRTALIYIRDDFYRENTDLGFRLCHLLAV